MVILPPFERSMSCVRWILLCLGKAKKKNAWPWNWPVWVHKSAGKPSGIQCWLTCLGAQECRQGLGIQCWWMVQLKRRLLRGEMLLDKACNVAHHEGGATTSSNRVVTDMWRVYNESVVLQHEGGATTSLNSVWILCSCAFTAQWAHMSASVQQPPRILCHQIGGDWEQNIFKILRQNYGIEEYHCIFFRECLASL
jgi:hypothetical protein